MFLRQRNQYLNSILWAVWLAASCCSVTHAEPTKASGNSQAAEVRTVDPELGEWAKVVLPPDCYAVVGERMSIYFDSLMLFQSEAPVDFEILESKGGKLVPLGTLEARRWTFVPQAKDVGQHKLFVRIYRQEKRKALGEFGPTVLHVVPADAGAGRKLTLLIVGDSLTHATIYPNEVADLLSRPGNPQWKMLGTHKPAGGHKRRARRIRRLDVGSVRQSLCGKTRCCQAADQQPVCFSRQTRPAATRSGPLFR